MDAQTVASGLAGYVSEVASALGVAREAVTFEVSDTATAYVGLSTRRADRPDRDLMLIWSERHGWAVAVEAEPDRAAYFGGEDLVPEPARVARFVAEVLGGDGRGQARPRFAVTGDRAGLAAKLARYISAQR
ncbi:hypothetical protein SAMN05421504_10959 [Amycolatopsis xylanica]|uniref:DUF6292 domain-containing protein n=1 Tax=Amycolatopsis xylanica TaxID=589385 RepID=A0A1H3Q2D1_9PSEU|nr:DUF6292 family protein [Amycolatopsis xylanica]SDZ07400.1 hypothetical protein SAMN05421504_10959 [Amycolatopsis xylanica]